MINDYAAINQRQAAAQIVATCKDISSAIECMAVWADWEAEDPKVICQNIASYIKNNVVNCDCCNGTGTIDERLGGLAESNPAATCPDCDGTGEFRLHVNIEDQP